MICRSDVVSSATSVSACYNMLIDCRAAATATESHDPRVGVAGSASSHGFRKMAKRTVTGAAVPRNPTSDNQGCRRGGAQPVSPRLVDSSLQMELVSNRMVYVHWDSTARASLRGAGSPAGTCHSFTFLLTRAQPQTYATSRFTSSMVVRASSSSPILSTARLRTSCISSDSPSSRVKVYSE